MRCFMRAILPELFPWVRNLPKNRKRFIVLYWKWNWLPLPLCNPMCHTKKYICWLTEYCWKDWAIWIYCKATLTKCSPKVCRACLCRTVWVMPSAWMCMTWKIWAKITWDTDQVWSEARSWVWNRCDWQKNWKLDLCWQLSQASILFPNWLTNGKSKINLKIL